MNQNNNKRERLDIQKQSVFEGVSSPTNSQQLHQGQLLIRDITNSLSLTLLIHQPNGVPITCGGKMHFNYHSLSSWLTTVRTNWPRLVVSEFCTVCYLALDKQWGQYQLIANVVKYWFSHSHIGLYIYESFFY